MDEKIILKRDSANVKKPFHVKNNIFLLYAPRNINTEPMKCIKIDSGILALIPENVRGFLTSKFRERNEVWIQRLWVKILNKLCELPTEIKQDCVLGFFVAELILVKFKRETAHATKKKKKKKRKRKKN